MPGFDETETRQIDREVTQRIPHTLKRPIGVSAVRGRRHEHKKNGVCTMLNSKIEDAFNKQLNAELYASYLYLSMSADFEAKNMRGMSRWMKMQSQEEYGHAMKFYGQLIERGGRIKLTSIDAPKPEWATVLAAFEDAYKHECKVTGMIHDMMNLAISEKDHAAVVFLQWFVKEQVEEEGSVLEIVDQLKMIGDAPGPLFMLDHHLGQRSGN